VKATARVTAVTAAAGANSGGGILWICILNLKTGALMVVVVAADASYAGTIGTQGGTDVRAFGFLHTGAAMFGVFTVVVDKAF